MAAAAVVVAATAAVAAARAAAAVVTVARVPAMAVRCAIGAPISRVLLRQPVVLTAAVVPRSPGLCVAIRVRPTSRAANAITSLASGASTTINRL